MHLFFANVSIFCPNPSKMGSVITSEFLEGCKCSFKIFLEKTVISYFLKGLIIIDL